MPDDTRAQLQKSYALIKQGTLAEAFSVITAILEREPDNAEAWWLMAHAAPTADDAILACEQVLKLKPGYEPAQRMLIEQKLISVQDLSAAGQRREAYLALKPILNASPNNVEAWWLAAQTAPMRSEAVAACQRVLALQPDHAAAQIILAEHHKLLATTLVEKERTVRRAKPKRRVGCSIGLIALLILMVGSLLTFISVTGNTLGLPIGGQFSAKYEVGQISKAPTIKAGSLVIGATHDYRFVGIANSFALILVSFPTTNGNPGKAIKLIDPSGQLLAIGDSRGKGTATLSTLLTQSGMYTLRLVGTSGTAQGAYVLQIALADASLPAPGSHDSAP